MQYSIATALSTVLLASTLTSAGVVQRRQAAVPTTFLTIKTGDGDAAVGTSVNVGSLQTADVNGNPLAGCTATLGDAGISCQAFSDAAGQTKLGNVFNSVTTGVWSDKCDGSTASVASDAANVGSICCADSLRFDKVCLGNQQQSSTPPPPPPPPPPSSTTSVTPPPPSQSTGSADGQNVGDAIHNSNQGSSSSSDNPWEGTGHSEHDFPVSIQLNGLSELAVQAEVDSNGQPQQVLNAVGITNIIILHAHRQVICEAFANGVAIPNSKFEVHMPVNLDPAGVNVDAVACKIA